VVDEEVMAEDNAAVNSRTSHNREGTNSIGSREEAVGKDKIISSNSAVRGGEVDNSAAGSSSSIGNGRITRSTDGRMVDGTSLTSHAIMDGILRRSSNGQGMMNSVGEDETGQVKGGSSRGHNGHRMMGGISVMNL